MRNSVCKKLVALLGVLMTCMFSSAICLSSSYSSHFHFGPELIVYKQDKDIASKKTRAFLGVRFTYEYLLPRTFYLGFDLVSAGKRVGFGAYFSNRLLPSVSDNREFMSLDLRLGYTLSHLSKKHLLSPFFGFGLYDIAPKNRYRHRGGVKSSLAYFSGGIKGRCKVSQYFDLGCNMKLLYVFREKVCFKTLDRKVSQKNTLWGLEVGFPCTWHPRAAKSWNIELEPYFLTLGFSKEQMAFGSRLLVGFSF